MSRSATALARGARTGVRSGSIPSAARRLPKAPPNTASRSRSRKRGCRPQVVEATAWGRRPRFLLRDRDAVFGGAFGSRLAALGIEQLLAPPRAPRANAVAERLIGTLRRECLDHLIVLYERHLHAVLTEFAGDYNGARPHRTLGLETPLPADRPEVGPIRARPVLGGLHHIYERAA